MEYTDEKKAKKRTYYLAHKKEILSKHAIRYQLNKERYHALSNKWADANREHCNERRRINYANRITIDEKFREYKQRQSTTYYQKNKVRLLEVARKRRDIRYIARYIAHNALMRGDITKPTHCEKCFIETIHITMHHADYSKPLEVVFLCVSCHGLLKRKSYSLIQS